MSAVNNVQEKAAPHPTGEIELGSLWGAMLARKWWIIVPTLLTFVASLAIVSVITPRYTSEARILLESRETSFNRPSFDRDSGASTTATFDQEGVQSQVQVITSFDLSRAVIKKIGLIGNPEFDPAESGLSAFSRLLVLLGLMKNPVDRTPENRVLESYYRNLTVYPVGRSRVVAVEFSSRDPELSAKAANTIAGLYLETVQAAKKETARSAGIWLSAAIEPLRARVTEAEAKVEAFRAQSGLIVSTNNATIIQQQLAELSTQLSAARDAKAQADSKARLIRDMLRSGRVFEISEVVNNELVRRLIEQRGSIKAQIARELRTLMPEHPQVKALQAQLNDVESQIRAAAERQVRTIESDARVASARVETLTAALEEQKKSAAKANADEVQLRALEREAKSLREQLESYLAKRTEALARDAENATPADARIISSAIVPTTPSFPKKLPIILVATLAVFGISTAIVAAREILSGRALVAEAPTPPETVLMAHGVAMPPVSADFDATLVGPDPEMLVTLAKRIAAERKREGALRLLLVAHDAGAREVAKELARGVAESARAVFVSLSKAVQLDQTANAPENAPGLVELTAGTVSFMEAIVRDPGTRLHLVGLGAGEPDALLAHPQTFALVMDALADTYDYVVIVCDADVSDALAKLVSANAENAILVGMGEEPDKRIGANFMRFERLSGLEPYVLMLGNASRSSSAPAKAGQEAA